MNNYSLHITPLVLWITSQNFGSKYVKNVKFDVIFYPMNKKCDANLFVL
jgi:hypothetical protein